MNEVRLKHITLGIGWCFIILSSIALLYGFYIVYYLAVSDSLSFLLPAGDISKRLDFIYNSFVVIMLLVLGINIVRFKSWILKLVIIICLIDLIYEGVMLVFSWEKIHWDNLSLTMVDIFVSLFLIWFFTRKRVKGLFN